MTTSAAVGIGRPCKPARQAACATQAPTPVDHALDLMGFPEEVQVTARMRCAHTFGDAEDYVKLILQAENAPLLDVEISSANAYCPHTYLVQGTRGCLVGDTSHLEWKYYQEEEAPAHQVTKEPLRNEKGEPHLLRREAAPSIRILGQPPGEETDDFNCKGLAFYRSLYRHLTEGTAFEIQLDQVRKQIAVIEEAHRQNDAYMPKLYT